MPFVLDWTGGVFFNVVFGTFNARKLTNNYSVVQEHCSASDYFRTIYVCTVQTVSRGPD